MARTQTETGTESAAPPVAQKLRKFQAPSELAPEMGVHYQSEERIQGVCATENLRALLDAFGLQERGEIQLPFQHIKKQHGEVWRMRVENATLHTVGGKHVIGHQWMYERQSPEQVSGQQ
jgi:hypothetical protein